MRASGMAATLVCVLSASLASLIAGEPLLADRDALERSQQHSTANAPKGDRFTWSAHRNATILQGQLDELAARGYRLVVFGSNYGDFLFERRPKNEQVDVKYVVVKNQRIAAFQDEVNRAISEGHRVTLHALSLYSGFGHRVTGLIEIVSRPATPLSVESPAVDASRREYRFIEVDEGFRGIYFNAESRLTRLATEGFRLVDMSLSLDANAKHSVDMLVEKVAANNIDSAERALAPAHLKWIGPRRKNLERELNTLGSQGYRLRVVGTTEGYETEEPLLLERPTDAAERPEYKVISTRDSTPEHVLIALNEAGARGFRLRHALTGPHLILEKLATAQTADYVFFDDLASLNAAAARGTIEGFSVFGYFGFPKVRKALFVLERLQAS